LEDDELDEEIRGHLAINVQQRIERGELLAIAAAIVGVRAGGERAAGAARDEDCADGGATRRLSGRRL
jgi:hypothetical protein